MLPKSQPTAPTLPKLRSIPSGLFLPNNNTQPKGRVQLSAVKQEKNSYFPFGVALGAAAFLPVAAAAGALETTDFLAAGLAALGIALAAFVAGAAASADLGAALEAVGAGLGVATAALEFLEPLARAGIAAPVGLATGFGAALRVGLLLTLAAVAAEGALLAAAEALIGGAGASAIGPLAAGVAPLVGTGGAGATFCLGETPAFGAAVVTSEAMAAVAVLPAAAGALGRVALPALFFAAPVAFVPLPDAALGCF